MKLKLLSLLSLICATVPAFGQQIGGTSQLSNALHNGLLAFLATSFVGGLIALLTPCVFPMVPVTVSFFSKRTHKPMLSAVIYALGIIVMFAIIGVGSAALFGAAQVARFAANPWVNLALAALFIVLALNLFGAFEFRIGFASKLADSASSKKDSLISPLIMGMAFSLTTFTCIGPIVAGLLVLAAKGTGEVYPILGMISFGLAFSLPFFILALFPTALSKMPKSGAWLGAVKPALGIIELAAAVKFLSNADLVWQLGLITRPVFVIIWGVLAIVLAAYLFGLPKIFSKTGWVRRGLGVAALLVGIIMLGNPAGNRLTSINSYLPPSPYPMKNSAGSGIVANSTQKIIPLTSYSAALAEAKRTQKNVFVDFTGVTCTNCRWMEDNVFPLPEVHFLLSKLVNVQLYTDRGTDSDNANQELEQKLGKTIALPYYAIVTPDGKVLKSFEGSTTNSQGFINFLR